MIVLLVVWAVAVANLTLFATAGVGPRNAVPFHTIWLYLSDGQLPIGIRVRNLAGNLVMLVPLGLALAAITRWEARKVAAFLIFTPAAIEGWQYFVATSRSVDIDDVILNAIGGLAGWMAGLAILGVVEVVAPMILDLVVDAPGPGGLLESLAT